MALTWRNVDAPDFSSSIRGYETFSNLLGNAFSGLERGLNRYDNTISEQVNNQIQLKIAAAQKAEDAKAIVSNLALDPNARRISGATLNMATERPNALIQQALNEENLGQTLYQNNRGRGFDAAADRASEGVGEFYANAAKGVFDPNFGAGLRFSDRLGLAKTGQEARRGALGIESDILGNKRTEVGIEGDRLSNAGAIIRNKVSEFDFGNAVTDRAESRAAADFLARIPSFADNAADAEAIFETPEFQHLPGTVKLAVMNQVGGLLGGGGNSGASGGGISVPSGSAMDTTRTMNYEARAAGFGSVPASIQNLGQASEFAKQINKAGVASSAMGTYQIVGSTLRDYAPKVFGDKWQDQAFTMENQDKIAEAIFNDHRGSAKALSQQWVSLSPAEAERVRKMPWAQAREVIAAKESSTSAEALRFGGRAAAIERADQIGQIAGQNPGDRGFAQSMLDNADVNSVVSNLVGKNGPYAGTNRGVMTQQVRRVMAEAKVNPATAAQLISDSVTGNDNGTLSAIKRRLTFSGTPNLGNGVRIDDDLLARGIKRFQSGDAITGAVASMGNADLLNNVQAAQANLEKAQAVYNDRLNKKQIRKNLPIQREQQALIQAQAIFEAARQAAQPGPNEGRFQGGPAISVEVPVATRRPTAPPSSRIISEVARRYQGPLSRNAPSELNREEAWRRALARGK